MVPEVWASLCESTPSSPPSAWRQVALRRGLSHDQSRTSLSVAGRGSGRQRAGYSRAKPSKPEGREEILPQVAQGLDLRTTGDHYGQAEKLWRSAAGDPAWRGTPPAPIPQQPRRELPSADPPARAADAGV